MTNYEFLDLLNTLFNLLQVRDKTDYLVVKQDTQKIPNWL